MGKIMRLLCLLSVVLLPLASQAQPLISADAEDVAKCAQSADALDSVCTIFGSLSKACKETRKEHSKAGCEALGEERGGCSADNYIDTEKANICNAAKRVCNVATKDYCTTAIHVACMKTIGKMCPDGMSIAEVAQKAQEDDANSSAVEAQAEVDKQANSTSGNETDRTGGPMEGTPQIDVTDPKALAAEAARMAGNSSEAQAQGGQGPEDPDAQAAGAPDAQAPGSPDAQAQGAPGAPDAQAPGSPDAQAQGAPDAQAQGAPGAPDVQAPGAP